jgi:hypothetical protein
MPFTRMITGSLCTPGMIPYSRFDLIGQYQMRRRVQGLVRAATGDPIAMGDAIP